MKSLYLFLTIAFLASPWVEVQAQERRFLTITVPFSFTAENANLAAGSYRVYLMNPYNRIRLESADGKSLIVAGSPQQKTRDAVHGSFVFRRIAGQYFLAEVREEGSNIERALPMGRLARELAKKNGNADQVATVLAIKGH